MKLLWLLNSNDLPSAAVPQSELRHKLIEPMLSEAIGEPVEIVAKALWPTPRAPRMVERWLGEVQPDAVYLKVNSFWFNHESVPLRLERMLGPAGPRVSRLLLAANEKPFVAHHRSFRATRDFLRRRIDGAYHYEPEEVVERVSECIRVVLRAEHVYLTVASTHALTDSAPNARLRARRERRRLQVHHGLRDYCAALGVDYIGRDEPAYLTRPPRSASSLQPDAFHRNAQGHLDDVETKFNLMLGICERARAANTLYNPV